MHFFSRVIHSFSQKTQIIFSRVFAAALWSSSEPGLGSLFLCKGFPTDSDGFKVLWDLQQGLAFSLRQQEVDIESAQHARTGKQQKAKRAESFLQGEIRLFFSMSYRSLFWWVFSFFIRTMRNGKAKPSTANINHRINPVRTSAAARWDWMKSSLQSVGVAPPVRIKWHSYKSVSVSKRLSGNVAKLSLTAPAVINWLSYICNSALPLPGPPPKKIMETTIRLAVMYGTQKLESCVKDTFKLIYLISYQIFLHYCFMLVQHLCILPFMKKVILSFAGRYSFTRHWRVQSVILGYFSLIFPHIMYV